MPRLRGALPLLVAAVLFAAPAAAQIAGHPFEASLGAGYFHYDARALTKDGPGFQGTLGWRAMPWLSFEGAGIYNSSKADTPGEEDRSFLWGGAGLRLGLRPAHGHASPYALTQFGYGQSVWKGDPNETLERGSGSVGFGVLSNILNQRTFLRIEAREMFFQEREQEEASHHFLATLGLHYVFGGKQKDQDLDGVRDWIDKCPDTPIGAKVDPNGCPLDADRDSVFDGLDHCPNTPVGCTVDTKGCPTDADGDGVCDGVDKCPDTPKGAQVDASGCPTDSDGDGIFDGLDKCPGTPTGCTIDSTGCPRDSDGDGVCDGLDQCANTPSGVQVTAAGCPIEITWMERQLLEVGVIRSGTRYFPSGKAELGPTAPAVLDSIAQVLHQYPTLKLEIGGHTDNTGSAKKNQSLSDGRAKAVYDYLVTKFPDLGSQLTWKGYGAAQPVAPNGTPKGRSMNRRVEARVLNPEALEVEREKRRYLLKGEAPPPAPAPAPPDTTRR